MKDSFNLLKPQRAPETFWEKFYVWAMTICRYIVVGVELFVVLAFFYRFKLDRDLNDARERVQLKVDKLSLYKEEEKSLVALEQKLSTYSAVKAEKGITNPFLKELFALLPSGIDDLEISFNKDRITIGGNINEDDLTKLEDKFKSSKSFKNVILKTRDKSSQDEKIKFEFEAEPIREFIFVNSQSGAIGQ